MNKKPDMVSLKWVVGLMSAQADSAEAALVEYGHNPEKKQALLRCMWAVHQITSTLRALGMSKGEMLTMEMERSLNFLYKDKIVGERRKLAMGGLMQALKIIPAYLEHTETVRVDTGRGLEQHVNDLRRWVGERPRPRALFFHMDMAPITGISVDARTASDDEIRSRANVMLALYLEMAKQALKKRKVSESMVTVARIARKMQTLFAGTEAERFWFVMVGLCEGMAGGLIEADECIAKIFKAGAFSIKYARENGSKLDASIDYDTYLQQMLYYVASCKSKPVHIAAIRQVFGIGEHTLDNVNQGLVHSDALVTALGGALERLNQVVDFLSSNDLKKLATLGDEQQNAVPLDAIEGAECRLIAAGQIGHAESLKIVQQQLKQFYQGAVVNGQDEALSEITSRIIKVKLDLEHKLEHGLNSSYADKQFELREIVTTATFKQMSLVENNFHQILRRKALKSALDKKPADFASTLRLTSALQRYLNKSDKGHEALREAIREADNGEPDLDLLYALACAFHDQLEVTSERKAICHSLGLMDDIAGALIFSGMEREGRVMEQCHIWLSAASDSGCVHEDDAFRCFADAFAQIEMHLQRWVLDPLDDTSHMLALAEQRAGQLENWIAQLPPSRNAAASTSTGGVEPAICSDESMVQDSEILPEFREVFLEESEELVSELGVLTTAWLEKPEVNEILRDIRRHFHTFKGNGRAVGTNILGELGWAAQDMLDRSLDGELLPDDSVQRLVNEVVIALPSLVESYSKSDTADVERIRKLTKACFAMASCEGQEQAEKLPEIMDVIGFGNSVAEQTVVVETVTY